MATAIQMFEALTHFAQALKDNPTAGMVLVCIGALYFNRQRK